MYWAKGTDFSKAFNPLLRELRLLAGFFYNRRNFFLHPFPDAVTYQLMFFGKQFIHQEIIGSLEAVL
jgi:hypothetical protein